LRQRKCDSFLLRENIRRSRIDRASLFACYRIKCLIETRGDLGEINMRLSSCIVLEQGIIARLNDIGLGSRQVLVQSSLDHRETLILVLK